MQQRPHLLHSVKESGGGCDGHRAPSQTVQWELVVLFNNSKAGSGFLGEITSSKKPNQDACSSVDVLLSVNSICGVTDGAPRELRGAPSPSPLRHPQPTPAQPCHWFTVHTATHSQMFKSGHQPSAAPAPGSHKPSTGNWLHRRWLLLRGASSTVGCTKATQ